MARGLSSSQIANLNLNAFRVEDLVEIYLTGGSYYYTTGNQPLTISTPTAGSQTFTARSFISSIDSIQEQFQPEAVTTAIQFNILSAEDTFLNLLATTSFINRRVVLYKLFRDISTVVPDTSNGLLQVFDGQISGLEIEHAVETSTYTLRLAGDFADFDKVRGRTTADVVGAMVQRKIYWGNFYLE